MIEGDRLLEVLAGSVTVDLPAPASGILSELLVSEEDELHVGQILAIVTRQRAGRRIGIIGETLVRGRAVAKKQHVAFAHHREWGMVACPAFAPPMARICIPPGDVYHAQIIDSVGADGFGEQRRRL